MCSKTANRPLLCLALTILWLVLSTTPAYGQDGSFDPTFGSGGLLFDGPFTGRGPISSAQSDGKLVMATNLFEFDSTTFVEEVKVEVVRVDQSGSLDTTFGQNGKTIIEFSDYGGPDTIFSGGNLWDVDVLGDDSIIITVMAEDYACPSTCMQAESDVVLVKLDASGAIAPGFGSSGFATAYFANVIDQNSDDRYLAPWTMKAASDGSLFVVGFALGLDRDLIMAKFSPTGGLDPSFGTGGELFDDTNSPSTYTNLTFLEDGRLLATGGEGDSAVDRMPTVRVLLADGSPDTSVSPTGMIELAAEQPGYIIDAMHAVDGGLLVVGFSGSLQTSSRGDLRKTFVRKLHPDLTIDTCFGGVTYSSSNPGWRLSAEGAVASPVTASPLLLLREDEPDPTAPFGSSRSLQTKTKLIRINQGGGPDSSFGTGGFVDLALDPDYEHQSPFRGPEWHDGTFVFGMFLNDADEVETNSSGLVRMLDGEGIFGDGFEVGDTLGWGTGCR